MTRPRDDLDRDDIIRRYESGQSLRTVAAVMGVTDKTISRQLRLAGVHQRTMSQAGIVRASSETDEIVAKRVTVMRAVRTGVPRTESTLAKTARTKQKRQLFIGKFEDMVMATLQSRFNVIPQLAVGKYNIDIAVPADKLAFEIHNSAHRPRSGRDLAMKKRIDYLTKKKWTLIYVWCNNGVSSSDLKKLVTLADVMRFKPSVFRKNLVFRCHGDRSTTGRFDSYEDAVVPLS